MNRAGRMAAALVWAGSLITPLRAEIGLGTQFTDAVMEGLEPGGVYNIRELRGVPYTVRNTGNAPVDVAVEVIVPEAKDARDGYEPIPDPSWIRLTPERHRIPPGGMAFSDIIVAVPDDPSFKGRHFIAYVRAKTVGTGLLGAGVKSQIRFSIGMGPKALDEEKRRKAMVTLNFELWPSSLYVMKARAGSAYKAAEEKKKLVMTNRSEEPVELVLAAAAWNEGQSALPEGYAAGNPSWVRFLPETVTVDGLSVLPVEVELNLPESAKGKKWAFAVEARLPIGTVVSASNRIFVTAE